MLKHDLRGEGPLVVLLHSGGMSGRQWRKLAERLSSRFRVLSPDFLGSGDNPSWPADAPFHFHDDVREILTLIDRYGPTAHLVGHSYGGLNALTVARMRPEAVRSLAVYDPVAFGVLYGADDQEGLEDLARASEDPAFVDERRGGGEDWFRAFVDYWNGPGAWAALPAPARESFLKVGRKVYYEVSTLLRDRTPASSYAVIHAPALLFTGERSPLAAGRVVEQLRLALPQARVLSVTGAGHMGPITHAAQVYEDIERHLAAAEQNRGEAL